MFYSKLAKGGFRGAFSFADPTFYFTLTCRSPALTDNYYSEFKLAPYQTISEHLGQGLRCIIKVPFKIKQIKISYPIRLCII